MKPLLTIPFCLLIIWAVIPGLSSAQTCSCAGAPLLSSQSSGAGGKGNLLIGLTYEFNQITNLYSGSNQLTNDSAERNTQSGLVEISYGLTDRLSISGTLSTVRKQRRSGLRNPGGTQTSVTSGIGDGIFMMRYTLKQQDLWNRYHFAVGIGGKAPIGSTSVRNDNNLIFNADMQPGSGAWDLVLWNQTAISLLPLSPLNLSWINSFRYTGKNARFTETDFYRFGNEWISNLTATNSLPFSDRLSYGLSVRYRSTSSDQRNDVIMPNTGGKWVSIIPDLFVSLTDRTTFKLSGQIPVYQHLNGTQPSTKYSLSAALFINFNPSTNTFTHGN